MLNPPENIPLIQIKGLFVDYNDGVYSINIIMELA